MLRVALLVLVACRSSDSFTVGTELGLPKPYDALRPGLSLAEAKRRVPALDKPERVDREGALAIDQRRLVVQPTHDGTSIEYLVARVTQDQADVLTRTWGPGEVRTDGSLAWFDAKRGVLAHLVDQALFLDDFMPLAELLDKGRPAWFRFETTPLIGTPIDRHAAKLQQQDERSGWITVAGTEWSLAGTRVDVSSRPPDRVVYSVTVWFKDQRKDRDLLREIDTVWGPHTIDTFDDKPVPVWRDPAAGRRAHFHGSYITVRSYQSLAKTLDLAASLVGARRAEVAASHAVKDDVVEVPPSEFQDLTGTGVSIEGDETITTTEVSEGASSHAARDAILAVLRTHYNVPVDAGAAESILRDREPRVIARYRPGLGEAGIVTITFTR